MNLMFRAGNRRIHENTMRTNAIRNEWNDHLHGTRETVSLAILMLYNVITFATFLCYDYFGLSSVRAILNCLNNFNHRQITIIITQAGPQSLVNKGLSVLSQNARIGSIMD